MLINFTCPTCGKSLSAPHEKSGLRVGCPGCKGELQVPFPQAELISTPDGFARAELPTSSLGASHLSADSTTPLEANRPSTASPSDSTSMSRLTATSEPGNRTLTPSSLASLLLKWYKSYLSFLWHLVSSVASATWYAIKKLSGDLVHYLTSLPLQRQTERALTSLGEKMYQQGIGDQQLRLELAAIDQEIQNAASVKHSTRTFLVQKRLLLARLAQSGLSQPTEALPALELASAQQSRKALQTHQETIARARVGQRPIEWKKAALGIGFVLLLLVGITNPPKQRSGPAIPPAKTSENEAQQLGAAEKALTQATKQAVVAQPAVSSPLPAQSTEARQVYPTAPTLVFQGHQHSISSLCFSSDGKLLASGADSDVFLWDVKSGRKLHHLKNKSVGRSNEFVSDIQFAPDGETLAIACMGQNAKGNFDPAHLRIWETKTGKEKHWIATDQKVVLQIHYYPQTQTILAAGNGLKVWDVATYKDTGRATSVIDADGWCILSPDGKRAASSTWSMIDTKGSTFIRIYDLVRHRLLLSDKTNEVEGGGHPLPGMVENMGFSSNGDHFGYVCNGSSPKSANSDLTDYVAIYDLRDKPIRRNIELPSGWTPVTRVSERMLFSNDGNTVGICVRPDVSGRANAVPRVWLWNVERRQKILDLDGESVTFVPTKHAVAIEKADNVSLYDCSSGRLISTYPIAKPITQTAFTRDGQFMATGSDKGEIRLWSLAAVQARLSNLSNAQQQQITAARDAIRDPAEQAVQVQAQTRTGPKDDQRAKPPVETSAVLEFKESRWTILKVEEKGQALKSNEQAQQEARTDGKFVLINFKVENTSDQEQWIADVPKLVDSKGRKFKQYGFQSFYFPRGGKGLNGEMLPAGVAKEFWAIYDVPADAKDIRFQIGSVSRPIDMGEQRAVVQQERAAKE